MNLRQNLKIIPLAAHQAAVRASAAAATSNKPQRILIDFSSPNIAKPFHFGHLKSTILGNFLANLNQFYGNHVTKLNYIGDWGTQYGLLSLGLATSGGLSEVSQANSDNNKTTLEKLLNVYVAATAKGAEDEAFYQAARDRFKAMDSGQDEQLLSEWRQIREVSLKELVASYEQLDIHFDVFEFESDHTKRSHELIEHMRQKNLLERTEDGVLVASVSKNNKQLQVPLLKSDGSSLYLTRDLVAAMHRKEQYQFDKLLYVVGANQEKHFHCLAAILELLGCAWAAGNLVHVKTGKVKGMSSRSGEAVLLAKIIETASEVYREATRGVPTSKVSSEVDVEWVGQQLALAALYVYDLRNKRTRDYQFDWDKVMVAGANSGINLQTTHARLCSLERKAQEERGLKAFKSLDELNYDSVCCIAGVHLINTLNELSRKLDESHQSLDASPLVNHALLLSKAINRARQSDWLHVLHEPDERKARSRLTLFESARSQLDLLIRLIGLRPLERV